MDEVNYHEIVYGVDVEETLRQLVLHKLPLFTTGQEQTTEFFNNNKFFTKLNDYRSFQGNFTVIQSLGDVSILVTKVEFVRVDKVVDGKVFFKPVFNFTTLNLYDSSYISLFEDIQVKHFYQRVTGDLSPAPSAFYFSDKLTHHAFIVNQDNKVFINENTFSMRNDYNFKKYELKT